MKDAECVGFCLLPIELILSALLIITILLTTSHNHVLVIPCLRIIMFS